MAHRAFFLDCEAGLYYSIMVDICNDIFVQTHRIYNTRVNPKVNHKGFGGNVGSSLVRNVPFW